MEQNECEWHCAECNKTMNYNDAGVHFISTEGLLSFCSDKCLNEFIKLIEDKIQN